MTTGQRRRGSPRQPVPGIVRERVHWRDGATVAGIDEVGRGAWAGPLTLAAVVLPADRRMYKLRDSKLLPAQERERLSDRLHRFAVGIGIGHASNDEIDRHGLSHAMRVAALRAVEALPVRPDVALLDGHWDFLDAPDIRTETIVRGDSHSASIAAASIVAKVARDRMLVACGDEHPVYGFPSNKGYPSPHHVAALEEHGPCELHRRSWAPIVALQQPRLFA
jgi:ribonuclease HII